MTNIAFRIYSILKTPGKYSFLNLKKYFLGLSNKIFSRIELFCC